MADRTERLEGRDGEIWRAYLLGHTQEALARKHGITQERVSAIVRAVRASIPPVELEEARLKHLDVMDHLATVAAGIMALPPAQAFSNGRAMFMPDGSPVLDYGTQLAALDRLVKINERTARVLGLDAPVKADVTVNEQAREATQQAAAEALARLQGTDE